jgi:PAS domain S-box-containing protein
LPAKHATAHGREAHSSLTAAPLGMDSNRAHEGIIGPEQTVAESAHWEHNGLTPVALYRQDCVDLDDLEHFLHSPAAATADVLLLESKADPSPAWLHSVTRVPGLPPLVLLVDAAPVAPLLLAGAASVLPRVEATPYWLHHAVASAASLAVSSGHRPASAGDTVAATRASATSGGMGPAAPPEVATAPPGSKPLPAGWVALPATHVQEWMRISPVFLVRTDPEMRTTWSANAHPDWPAERTLGLRPEQFLAPEAAAHYRAVLEEALATRRTARGSFTSHLQARAQDFTLTVEPLLNDQGEVVSLALLGAEVTDERQLRQDLYESDGNVRSLLSHTHISMGRVDRDLRYIWYFNPQLGIKASDVLGKSVGELRPSPETTKVAMLVRYVMETGTPGQVNYTADDATGDPERRRTFDIYIDPTYDADGNVDGASLVSIDVTHHRRLADELRERVEQLRAASDLARLTMVTVAPDMTCLYISPWGGSNEFADLAGRRLDETLPAGIWNQFAELLDRARTRARAESTLLTIRGNRRRDFQVTVLPVFREDGTLREYQVAAIEVTDLRTLETELRRANDNFRTVLRQTPLILSNVDRDLQYIWVHSGNPHFTAADMQGKKIGDLLPPDQRALFQGWIRSVMETGQGIQRKMTATSPSGDRLLSVSIQPTFDEDGELTGAAVASLDITAHEQMSAALIQSERRYRRVIEATTASVWHMDAACTSFLEPSPSWFALTGHEQPATREEFLQAFHPDDQPRVQQCLVQAVAERERCELDVRLWHHESGTFRWAELRMAPLLHDNGELAEWVGAAIDVDDRERARQGARERQQELETLLDILPVIVFIAQDPEGKHISGNEAGRRVLRMPRHVELSVSAPEEVRPQHFHVEIGGKAVAPEDLPVQFAARTNSDWVGEEDVVFNDGTVISLVGSARPLHAPDGSVRGAVAAFMDITQQKLLERELRESQSRFTAFMDNLPAIAYLKDGEGRLRYLNKTSIDTVGLPLEEIIGRTAEELLGTERASEWESNDRLVLAEGRAMQFRETWLQEDGAHTLLAVKFPLQGADGEPLLGGVGFDVTEQMRTADALARSEERLRTTTEAASLGLWELLGDKARINRRLADLYSMEIDGEEAEVAVEELSFRLEPSDLAKSMDVQHALYAKGEGSFYNEFRVARPEGGWRTLASSGRLYPAHNGRPPRLVGVTFDVSDRVAAAEALARSERRVRAMAQSANVGLWEWDGDQTSIWSKTHCDFFGIACEGEELEIDVATAYGYMHPDDAPGHMARTAALMEKGSGDLYSEFRIAVPGRPIRAIALAGRLYPADANLPIRMMGVSWDITERVEATLALANSEARLRLTTEAARVGLWEWDGGDETLWSRTLCDIVGIDCEGEQRAVRMEDAYTIVHPDDLERYGVDIAQAMETDSRDFQGEYSIRRPDGELRVLSLHGRVYPAEGTRPKRMLGITWDVTDRVRATEALERSEQRLRMSTTAARIGLWEWEGGATALWSRIACENFGIDCDDNERQVALETAYSRVHPEDRSSNQELLAALFASGGGEFYDELRILPGANEAERVVAVTGRVLPAEGENPARMAGVSMDITQRVEAAQALARSEERLRMSTEAAGLGLWEWDGGPTARWSRTACEQFGIACVEEVQDVLVADAYALMDPESVAINRAKTEALVQAGGGEFHDEFRVNLPGHPPRFISVSGRLFPPMGGRPLRMLGVTADVTQRVEAAQALARSEERLRMATDAANIGLWEWDGGPNAFFSPVQAELSGLPRVQGDQWLPVEEAFRRIHPDDITYTSARLGEALAQGSGEVYNEFRVLLSDGKVRVLAAAGSVFPGHEDRPARLMGVSWDITQQRELAELRDRAQAELKELVDERTHDLALAYDQLQFETAQRLLVEEQLAEIRRLLGRSQELERVRLAHELHDGPMQELAALSVELTLLANRLRVHGVQSDTVGATMELRDRVREVSLNLRSFAGDLRPPVLDSFGVASAITAHVEQMLERYPNIAITLDVPAEDLTLDESLQTAIYRVFQQALYNVYQHANARHATVRLTHNEGDVMLLIEDDGMGFDVPESWVELARGGHLGIVGMSERAAGVGGLLRVSSKPGAGTRVEAVFPLLRA